MGDGGHRYVKEAFASEYYSQVDPLTRSNEIFGKYFTNATWVVPRIFKKKFVPDRDRSVGAFIFLYYTK